MGSKSHSYYMHNPGNCGGPHIGYCHIDGQMQSCPSPLEMVEAVINLNPEVDVEGEGGGGRRECNTHQIVARI